MTSICQMIASLTDDLFLRWWWCIGENQHYPSENNLAFLLFTAGNEKGKKNLSTLVSTQKNLSLL